MQILMYLNTNGRITMTELANRLHISRPAVQRRIKRMEDFGIIVCYTVEIDWKRIEPAGEDDDGI
jgi:Lrp/AsnC family leucine-responsive transcriptional regulator